MQLFLCFLCVSLYLGLSEETVKQQEIVSLPAVMAFGDSYVDSGNNNYVNTVIKADFRPYGKDFSDGKPTGRFSNGKTLADLIAKLLGVKDYLPAYLDPSIQDNDLLSGVNFASAASGYDPLTPKLTSVISLSRQLDLFKEYIGKLNASVGEQEAKNIINNSLFLVVVGTIDLSINYFDVSIRKLQYDVPDYAKFLVMQATNFTQDIYKLGARRIGVFSSLPTGCLPAQRTLGGGIQRNCVLEQNKAAELFNNMLKEQLQSIGNTLPNSKVVFVDIYNPVLRIVNNPQQYGLEVVDRGCCGSGLIEVSFLCNILTPTCSNDSTFFFWDSFHPTERGYEIVANQVLQDLVKIL